jgi:GntR family transcriptional regulator
MSFPLDVDLDSAVLLYAQIERQLRALLANGRWRAGERLPSVRETAVRLQVNPLTVVKAYRILQDEGLLESRPGAGIYAAQAPRGGRGERRQAVLRKLEEAVGEAGGMPREELEELFEQALLKRGSRSRA